MGPAANALSAELIAKSGQALGQPTVKSGHSPLTRCAARATTPRPFIIASTREGLPAALA